MSGMLPPVPPPLGANTSTTSSPNRVDNMPTNNINNTTTNNVAQNVVDENLPQLLDTRGGSNVTNVPELAGKIAREGPSNTKDTKIAALRLKFNAFKALDGEKVNGTFTRLKCLLNDLENNSVYISQAEDSDSDVEEDTRSSNEFLADLNAEFHDRVLLANQKRYYKR
ncbi:hypothetical protein Tco_0250403 [Tanacetum coccineum]